jgi:hypothetical protein
MTTASPSKTRAGWRVLARGERCAGCGEHNTFCTVSSKGDVCLCRKGAVSSVPVPQKGGAPVAYMHAVGGEALKPSKPSRTVAVVGKLSDAELKRIVKGHQSALTDRRLEIDARSLGLATQALRAYGAGLAADVGPRGSLSFPMCDGDGAIVGVRLRSCDPAAVKKQMCVKGSRNGLFIPADFDPAAAPDPYPGVDEFAPLMLALPEGPTDAAAAWQCGFQAVGRPSCNGGADMVRRLLQRCRQAGAARDVVVVADADATHWYPDHTPYWPGWEGAIELAGSCIGPAASIRVVKPSGAKDLRAALNATDVAKLGASLVCLIGGAEVVTQAWVSAHRRLIDRMKVCCREKMADKRWATDAERDKCRRDVEAFVRALVAAGQDAKWLSARQARKAG